MMESLFTAYQARMQLLDAARSKKDVLEADRHIAELDVLWNRMTAAEQLEAREWSLRRNVAC